MTDVEEVSKEEYDLLNSLVLDAEQKMAAGDLTLGVMAKETDEGPARRTRAASRRKKVEEQAALSFDTTEKIRKRTRSSTATKPAAKKQKRTQKGEKDIAKSPPPSSAEAAQNTPPETPPSKSQTHVAPITPQSPLIPTDKILPPDDKSPIAINRAPVLCLWAATVAAREGHEWKTALSIGKAIMVLFAQSKGTSIGVFEKDESKEKKGAKRQHETCHVFGINVPVMTGERGDMRACVGDKPCDPIETQWYLRDKFGARYI